MKKKATSNGSSRRRDAIDNTSRAAQQQRLLNRLRLGPVDTLTARQELNVMHPGGRVQELRELGHKIDTQRITITDEHGRTHRGVALYTLIRLAKGWRARA